MSIQKKLLLQQVHLLRPLSTGTNTEGVTVEPPPAGGHLPSISNSSLLCNTKDKALHTPGIVWADDESSHIGKDAAPGCDTRKMSLYQEVRDAMR